MSTQSQRVLNPRANVFLLLNLGCEALFVIDQRLKAQLIPQEKSVQVIRDITTVLLEPKFIESLISGSIHESAQLLTVEHCKFMINDIATCSLMRLDGNSMEKLWSLMTMLYKWQLFLSRHQHHLLDITFRHLDAVNKLNAKRHLLIDYTKNTLLDFWNSCDEQQQLSIYGTNKAWLQCFNTKITLLIRLGFQSMDGSFLPAIEHSQHDVYVQSIGENIYIKSSELALQQQLEQQQSQQLDLAAQLNIPQSSGDLQPMDANQFQRQFEQTFSNILFEDTDNNLAIVAPSSTQANNNANGCEFVQLPSANGSGLAGGNGLQQDLLDLYSKMA
ncbi:CG13178 [Drosophila busckii]|uniref:CG13178 n=1 Tax=Drosophila busckii TaxID=30019 RepID=A0A0M4EL29_DROBS|nr:protein OSCP1 [Drosophila busckii]ALC42205.1 CG13178 [Drosophila busckii]